MGREVGDIVVGVAEAVLLGLSDGDTVGVAGAFVLPPTLIGDLVGSGLLALVVVVVVAIVVVVVVTGVSSLV